MIFIKKSRPYIRLMAFWTIDLGPVDNFLKKKGWLKPTHRLLKNEIVQSHS